MPATDSTSPSAQVTKQIYLEPADNLRLNCLFGAANSNLLMLEKHFGVQIAPQGHRVGLSGEKSHVNLCAEVLRHLYRETESGEPVSKETVQLFIHESGIDSVGLKPVPKSQQIQTPKLLVKPRGENQLAYVKSIKTHDINFGIGPAGTGKTYLAVACAVEALSKEEVKRILLVRPAVEAGEKLGFLPGDLAQKVDPYLRPLYDALYDMLGFEQVGRLIDKGIIEVAPLAFMRGRTLNHSFIILDESQNTTKEQMKMFLTRIGFGSTAVITGDITQIDLPKESASGLAHIQKVLNGVNGIGFTHFSAKDVVRHPLVQRIVEAYSRHENNTSRSTA